MTDPLNRPPASHHVFVHSRNADASSSPSAAPVLEPGPPSPVRFWSYESIVPDDDDNIFSQFIRPPSPDDIPTTIRADQVRQTVINIDDLISTSSSSFSETGLWHRSSEPNCPPDVPVETRQKPWLRS